MQDGGKAWKSIDTGWLISPADLGVHVMGLKRKPSAYLRCIGECIGGGSKMFGNIWDKGCDKKGGGWCISDAACFCKKSMDLILVEKRSQISNICVVGVW